MAFDSGGSPYSSTSADMVGSRTPRSRNQSLRARGPPTTFPEFPIPYATQSFANRHRVVALQKQDSLQSVQKRILDSPSHAFEGLEAICNFIPIPSLLFAVQAASRIFKIAQAIATNRVDCQELLGHISALVVAVIAPLIGEPAERTEPYMLDKMDKLKNVLTEVSESLRNLNDQMRSMGKATPQDAQERIDGCLAKLTRATPALQFERLVQVDIDRLGYYLDTKKNAEEMRALFLMEQRLKPAPARYNSSARGGVSGCLEGTRVAILQQLRDWIFSPDDARVQLFWLKGQAGTGKSAIAHTISADCAVTGNLGASFFFSRDQADRADGLRVFPTIAYQLAYSIPGFRVPLITALQDSDEATGSDPLIQFKRLIIAPLRGVSRDAPSPIVIVLDALDECENSSFAAAGIVTCLAGIASQLPDWVRLRVLITSRPEPVMEATIRALVSGKGGRSQSVSRTRRISTSSVKRRTESAMKLDDIANLDDIETNIVQNDISHYLKNRLQDNRPIATDTDVKRLVEITQGLFIVASTAAEFIDNAAIPSVEGKKMQLEALLSAEDSYRDQKLRAPQLGVMETGDAQPSPALDPMYSQILQMAVSRWRKTDRHLEKDAQTVLGAVALLRNPLSPQSLEALLQLPPNTVTNTLMPLHSVVVVPDPDKVDSAPFRLIHPSFPDFLVTPSRCIDTRFFIDPPLQHSRIALHCLDHMSESLIRDMCGIGFLPTLNSDVKDLHNRLRYHIPLHLQYACFYWPLHLARAGLTGHRDEDVRQIDALQLVEALGKFIRTKLLCWLEVMSLFGRLDAVEPLLHSVEYELQSDISLSETLEIVRDVGQFVNRFYKPISESAGAIYSSALPLTPRCRLYNQYQYELTQPNASAIVRLGQGKGWDQANTPTHGPVTSVAFSPNGAYIAAAFSDETVQLWAHIGLSLATLVDPTSPNHPRAVLLDNSRLRTISGDRTLQAYDGQTRSHVVKRDGESATGDSVSFTPDSRQVVFRSSTGERTWARDISRYPVDIPPKDISGGRGYLQWQYSWITYLDWRLCYLEASDWIWASRGHQMTLGTPSGEVLLLDFSSVIRVVDKYRSQGVAPNSPLPFHYAL